MDSNPTAGLKGRALACRRGGRTVFQALDLRATPGDLLVLRGANGAGKSSLLRVLAGLLAPAAGTLDWDGEAIGEDPAAHRARLAFIAHTDALKPTLTLAEHLHFHAALRGASGTNVAAALDAFGLAALADTPARFLSQGQRRRAALARLLAAPAPLWLLDEPTNGLDAPSVDALARAVARHRAAGGVVVAATHLEFAGASARTLTLGAA
ncbi:MAG: heme ABC exporter ATP-binding protein CcmA [Alphaproteobacteria bacterium]|nr:heme ABC exporter ATP-binding protein CcmA [Alphaproteobacteria bacterium]